MKDKPRIKVRKKSAVAEAEAVQLVGESATEDPTKLKSTVTGWVTEFQERHRIETEIARKQLDS